MAHGTNKRVRIDGQFADLKGDCYAVGVGSASTLRVAAARAIANLLSSDKIKGRRIHTFKMVACVIDPPEETAAKQ